MNKVNYAALVAIAIAVFSIFMPWVQVSAAAGTYDLSQSFQPITISGIAIGYGIIGLLIALLGAFLAYKENKWAFIAGIANVIDGYGYLHGWFGAGTHDSGNYGDVTSRSTVDFKLGLYLFILASLAFAFFTLKNYKSRKKAQPAEKDIWWDTKDHQQPAAIQHSPTPVYQPSKIQTMTTTSSETPESTETPKVPVPSVEKDTEQPAATTPEKETPAAPAQPVETPAPPVVTPAPPVETPVKPVQAVVNEPAPVIPQAPREQPVYQQEKKKSSTSWIMVVILAIVLVGAGLFVFTNNTSEKSKNKTEQSVNDEKARLQVIINEVNQDVSDKKYDDALLKINSINWLYEPDANKGYVDQYNSQRENLRATIEQMKTNQGMQDQQQAAEKAAKAAEQSEQKADSVH